MLCISIQTTVVDVVYQQFSVQITVGVMLRAKYIKTQHLSLVPGKFWSSCGLSFKTECKILEQYNSRDQDASEIDEDKSIIRCSTKLYENWKFVVSREHEVCQYSDDYQVKKW